MFIPRDFTPTGNATLDSAMMEVRRGLTVVDSIAKLDPDAYRGLGRPAPGSRPRRGAEVPAAANASESATRSQAAKRALDQIDAVIDAAVAGRVSEQDLLRARQAVERLEREPGTMEERRRARYTGMMLQALITRSPADCTSLKAFDPLLRRFLPQQARNRAVVAVACGH